MEVPFFDLKRLVELEKPQLEEAARRVVTSGHYILGREVNAFEDEFSRYLLGAGTSGFVGCNSGTDAIVLSLLAAGVEPGGEVVVPSNTAIPTVSAIVSLGARPVFCDVDKDTWLVTWRSLETRVSKNTQGVVLVHLYGNMVDIPAIRRGLKEQGLTPTLIEDVAQATGSRLGEKAAGTLGDFGAFSFYPTKNIGALGDGGGVFCANSNLSERLRMLRNYGQRTRYLAELPRGLNSRLDEMQAAILRVRLAGLDKASGIKDRQMALYRQGLSELPIALQLVTPGCKPCWHLAVIATESGEIRDRLMRHLEEKGVQTLIHYPNPVSSQPAFKAYADGRFPHAESLATRILSLPLNVTLTPSEQEYVIQSVRSFF